MIHIEKMNDKTQVSDEKEVEYIDIEWWNSTRKPTITLDIYTAWTIRSHFVDTDVAYRIERRKKRELKIFSLFQGLIQWTKKKRNVSSEWEWRSWEKNYYNDVTVCYRHLSVRYFHSKLSSVQFNSVVSFSVIGCAVQHCIRGWTCGFLGNQSKCASAVVHSGLYMWYYLFDRYISALSWR